MGLLFTVVYIITAYLAPDTVWGPLAEYRIEIVIAVLALIFSIFSASGSNVFKLPQSWAIVGLVFAVAMSEIANHWMGGAVKDLGGFIPDVVTFFLIVMNCREKWHLKVLAFTLFFCAAFSICQAEYAVYVGNMRSLYILNQRLEEGTTIIVRIRGLSFLGDPNDFAQFLVSLIPIMFVFWTKGAALKNFLLVYVPGAILFWGMYLSHSRGSMVAFMALCIVAFRKKIGVVPSIIGGVMIFALLTAAGFSGGRDVSAGEDRLAAWAQGLILMRSHPLFGVGFQRFSEYNDITAHNTFVVCTAEIGFLGAFFWVLLIYVTIRNSLMINRDPGQDALDEQKKLEKIHAKQPFLQGIPNFAESSLTPATVPGSPSIESQGHQYGGAGAPFVLPPDLAADYDKNVSSNFLGFANEEDDKEAKDAEIRRLAGLMVLSFAGFLTAGWFLSRAYTMCLYVNAGLAAAVFRMAQDRGIAPPIMKFGEAAKGSIKTIFVLLVVVWVIVHVDHYMPK